MSKRRRKKDDSRTTIGDILSLWPFALIAVIILTPIFSDLDAAFYNIGRGLVGLGLFYAFGKLLEFIEINNHKRNFKDRCFYLIDKYEEELPTEYYTCKYVISDSITLEFIKNLNKDFSDYHAQRFIMDTSLKLLVSGRFRTASGELDENSEAPALCKVFSDSAEWLLNQGCISRQEYDEFWDKLETSVPH